MTSARRVSAVLTLSAVLLAGCGVPIETRPRAIDPPHGPFQALASPTPAAPTAGPVAEKLFLVKDDMLLAVTRHVNHPPAADALIRDLVAGPTDAERDAGITSALLGGSVVDRVDIVGGRATVDLSSTIESTARNDEVLAYAQLVCTLLTRPDISGVTFTSAGRTVAVPRGDGSLSAGPLDASDYAGLIATRSPGASPTR